MLITVEELEPYLGGLTLTTEQLGIVEKVIIPGIQEELEIALNRPVEPVQVRESLIPDEMGYIRLSISPVWKLISARYSDGTTIPTTVYYPPAMTPDPSVERRVDYSGLGMSALPYTYSLPSLGLPGPFGGYGGLYTARYVVVEYIGGYYGLGNQALQLAMCRVAARECVRMFDDSVSTRQGNIESGEDADNRPKGWQDEELKRFERLRRRVIV